MSDKRWDLVEKYMHEINADYFRVNTHSKEKIIAVPLD